MKANMESYVRLKRKKQWYLVKVREETFTRKDDLEFTSNYLKLEESFNKRCLSTQYLWEVPKKEHLNDLIAKEAIIIDFRSLNNKELFLLNFRHPHI